MPPSAAAAISQVTAFLNQVFSREQDRECPYESHFQGPIQQHLLDLVGDIPSLAVKQQNYTHYDGRSAKLLVAEGTVPMYYQNVKYNIPVAIWLPEQYPLYPPLMYVSPTPDMIIKPRHTFVEPSGMVHSPYMRNWNYPTSNLRELAQDASILFSGDPPLYSKPPGWVPPSTAAPSRPYTGYPPPHGSGSPSKAGYPGAAQDQHGPHSPTAFHAENPMAILNLGSSAGSFTSSSGGSFTSRPSPAPSFPTNSMHPPQAAAGSGSIGGHHSWGGLISGGALGAMSAAAGSRPPVPSYPGSLPQPPLGSGPPAQHHKAQQPQQQPQPYPHPQAPLAMEASGGTMPTAASAGEGRNSAADDATRELQLAFRTAAIAALSKRLASSVAAASSGASAEVESLLSAQAELAGREVQLHQEVALLQSERTTFDKAAQDVVTALTQLDQWLASNAKAVALAMGDVSGPSAELDPDTVIEASDALSQQALDAQAQDLALEDTLYSLDKALNAGLVQPDAYVKQVRAVCRRQFMARALGNKIAAKQSEARRRSPTRTPQPSVGSYGVPSMQAAPPAQHQQSVQMPQGDSWYSSGILPNPLAAQR